VTLKRHSSVHYTPSSQECGLEYCTSCDPRFVITPMTAVMMPIASVSNRNSAEREHQKSKAAKKKKFSIQPTLKDRSMHKAAICMTIDMTM